MKDTCINCKNYYSTLSANDGFHIHDYCSAWNKQIPHSFTESPFTNDYCEDDIERGIAKCWLFERREYV